MGLLVRKPDIWGTIRAPRTGVRGRLPLGLAGFEPTTYRRGDRSILMGRSSSYDRVLLRSNALVVLLGCDSQSFHCAADSTGCSVVQLLNDRHYVAQDDLQRFHTIQHNGDRSCCFAERKREILMQKLATNYKISLPFAIEPK